MGYVPGFEYDLFVSYAHGDDREWISRLIDRLESELKRRLGLKVEVWMDDDKLRKSRDFSAEIPESVKSSAIFLLFPSPTYIRSQYCIGQECKTFEAAIPQRRTRFAAPAFQNELFALRIPILPIDGNEHWSLFPGLTDIAFCDESATFAAGTPEFEASFRRLVGELAGLLKRMRNHSRSVFLWPAFPGADLKNAHESLTAELSAQSYRILPDRNINLPDQLREASLSVFLLGPQYDETASDLADLAADRKSPGWCGSPLPRNRPRRPSRAVFATISSSSIPRRRHS